MDVNSLIYIILFFVVAILLAWPLGKYMSKVFSGEKNFMTPLVRPVEKFIYRICGVDEAEEMTWKGYAKALILFNILAILFVFIIQLIQGILPLNPEGFSGVRWDTALNTAISFVTNTNWQAYAGETTMSYLTQMVGLAVQNFLSAAVGMAAALVLIRGFIRKNTDKLGNFWVDITRMVLYILLPLSIILAILLVSQGVVQTFDSYATAQTIEGASQIIPLGPVASQEAIKMLGSNGGGFFNVNSAHPFENPNGFTNLLETLAIILIPMSLVFMFGYLVRNIKQGLALFAVMMVLLIMGLGVALWSEDHPNPVIEKMGVTGQNMEGKEVRLGTTNSVLWGVLTTDVSNGGVNSMHDSTMPLTGLVYMFNMGTGEVIFGGIGVGLAGLLFYVILTMFIAGLMIGRTPEFLGKKLGPYEMKLALIPLIGAPASVLILSALALSTPDGLAGISNPSAHGLSEILYAYFSTIANNGSAFGGLTVNTVFYNLTTGLAMLIGRFATIIPAIAIAGALAQKGKVSMSSASFPTTGPLFVIMVVAVVIIIGALTFFPVFALGPGLEHLFLQAGKIFA
ncbi:potassium-transporting ATPase subunit KdpA [Methanobacterium paludis]|uniref:Potassium-transporting ATPase potassium-binding subunit n=1 Tax=Methanobacterium paludis (strain DSM 25820 / JCM 18151 / SWAN1) TaxID=868131 RepID=F6D4T7_METPW|nr:potassium-transporting ATPase subunit KdpA [Methanobacterium paludis]AEG18146.1 Potassium-transporting ATPase A chain [Methanobacterium paludis]